MTEPVWTEWLENPRTGECPVPDFAERHQVYNAVIGGASAGGSPHIWNWESNATTHYCYAIPADLAWLAENVSEWKGRTDGYVVLDKQTNQVYFDCGTKYGNSYDRPQWLRARKDLGYDTAQDNKEASMSSSQKEKSVDQCRLEMLNSFYSAVVKAGGDPRNIISMDMTLEEMIRGLAQNGIRFCYDKHDSAGAKQ